MNISLMFLEWNLNILKYNILLFLFIDFITIQISTPVFYITKYSNKYLLIFILYAYLDSS